MSRSQIYTAAPKVPSREPVKTGGNFNPVDSLQNISFSGADAVATMIIPKIGENGKLTNEGDAIVLGDLQTISYSIHRENSPVRTLGHTNVRGFVKGSRTIAGSLIFTVFNEYAFYKITKFRELLGRESNGFFAPLADMLPPFDVVISFYNEYGQSSKMKIFGISIVDEGQTVSIDDLLVEQTYTYMARGIQPMVALRPVPTGDRDLSDVDGFIARNVFGEEIVANFDTFYSARDVPEVKGVNP